MSQRFHFVDGLRALCALFVVEHHIFYEIFESKQWVLISQPVQLMSGWLRHGYISVAAFIVLSGFCLMLPVVANGSDSLAGGVKSFLLRRARRILPPYYAALGLCLLLLLLVPGFNRPSGFHWDWSVPGLTKNAIISHLLLIHNLNPTWITKIDHPLWSIAIEWQIYFVFALLLIPIRRKFGTVAAIACACALGAAPGLLFHTGDWTRPWYLGLFSVGMLSATIACSPHSTATYLRGRIPWGLLTVSFGMLEMYFAAAGFSQTTNEIATAIALMCCLVWGCSFDTAKCTALGRAAMSLLREPRLVSIGIFSYSIYLIHAPIIALLRMALELLTLAPTAIYGLLLLLGSILSVAIGYAFFLMVERPFLRSRIKSRATAGHAPLGVVRMRTVRGAMPVHPASVAPRCGTEDNN